MAATMRVNVTKRVFRELAFRAHTALTIAIDFFPASGSRAVENRAA